MTHRSLKWIAYFLKADKKLDNTGLKYWYILYHHWKYGWTVNQLIQFYFHFMLKAGENYESSRIC
jgi:hypothetical protein